MNLLYECLLLRTKLGLPNMLHIERLRRLQDGTRPWTVDDNFYFLYDRKDIYDFIIHGLLVASMPTTVPPRKRRAVREPKKRANNRDAPLYQCSKCGKGPYSRTDAVRKHARKFHDDWVFSLTPSEFAAPYDEGPNPVQTVVSDDDSIPIVTCDDLFAEFVGKTDERCL